MMGIGRYLGALLLVATVAGSAHAAANSPMIIADAGKAVTAARFMSLDGVRRGVHPVRTVPPAMRSDRAMLQSGHMRIDRAGLGTVRRQPVRAIQQVKVEPVRILSPQDSAVLDLFGESDAPTPTPVAKYGRVAHAWPIASSVAQRFTSGYGHRSDPIHGRKSFHSGIDIAAAKGTAVMATADGVVTAVTNGGRIGKYVSIKHSDGSESSYGHLSAQSVRVGQKVRQGQQIGAVGSTGRSTGPHLHYALERGGAHVNPMTALRQPSGTNPSVASSRSLNGMGGARIQNGVKIIR